MREIKRASTRAVSLDSLRVELFDAVAGAVIFNCHLGGKQYSTVVTLRRSAETAMTRMAVVYLISRKRIKGTSNVKCASCSKSVHSFCHLLYPICSTSLMSHRLPYSAGRDHVRNCCFTIRFVRFVLPCSRSIVEYRRHSL